MKFAVKTTGKFTQQHDVQFLFYRNVDAVNHADGTTVMEYGVSIEVFIDGKLTSSIDLDDERLLNSLEQAIVNYKAKFPMNFSK